MNRPLAPGSRLSSTSTYTRAGTRIADLRDVAWIDPVHLVTVAAAAHAAHRDGAALRVYGPSNPQLARYAARMRLGEVVENLGFEHDLPAVPDSPATDHLVEVALVRDARRMAELVHNRVRDLDETLAQVLHQGIAEIGENVHEHAQSVGYVAAQTIPRRGELRFAVADPGVGLQATLAPRGAGSDLEAIDLALAGVSSNPRGGTGVRETVAAVVDAGGYVYLASGGGAMMVTARRRIASVGAPFSGTIVEGRVPTRRARGTMES